MGDLRHSISIGRTEKIENRRSAMQPRPQYMENPDKLEIATEVLSSAVRILKAAGFYENEISELFEQAAGKPERAPLWLQPLTGS
jgi:hypothetical protein